MVARKKQIISRTSLDPLWYKDAIIYELHVRAFFDSDADGIGDFRGLTQKLDYLQDLGVTAIWLLPFYPSPLRDDGYDIADYYSINPIYGTLRDFKGFLNEAHERNLRVITELVVNHTSDQHPWFQRSRRAKPGSAWRNFYVWSDKPERYAEARIIFRDFEPSNWSWDPLAQAYYWHRFYAHQPDLNFDNPLVHKEIGRVLDFWLDLGVDGLRLDAVPYLYEREGTSCENLLETHAYLKKLRTHVDQKYGDRMLLAEANQWPEDAVSYFGGGRGDECHMAFHFPLMPRIFMAVRMEDRVPIIDILEQTPPVPETSQWALFLRNHDELTLEMVTDEERDYMYRVYASESKARINLGIRRRLAPLLGHDRKRIELLNLLLFSLPGTPVLYYGDEIGMGDNVFLGDRNGVRTPMQWSSDKNAGFSRATPQALYLPVILDPEYHYEAINVEAQQRNPHSLFWWMKRTLTLRKRHPAFGRGTLEFLQPDNRKILAFVRRHEQETILVIANLSRFPQPVQLDLAEFAGQVPIELFGREHFPLITDKPYFLTLSPHAAFWFALEKVAEREAAREAAGLKGPVVVLEHWEDMAQRPGGGAIEVCLREFMQGRQWFGGHGREVKAVVIREAIEVPLPLNGQSNGTPAPSPRSEAPAATNGHSDSAYLLVLGMEYREGDPESYILPVAMASGKAAQELEQKLPEQIMARLRLTATGTEGYLYAAARNPAFARAMLQAIARRRSFQGADGELKAWPLGRPLAALPPAAPPPSSAAPAETGRAVSNTATPPPANLEPTFGRTDQSNKGIFYGDRFYLKIFRRPEVGTNPDLEIGLYLTEQEFPNIAPVVGAMEYDRPNGEHFTVGVLTRFIPNAQDAWSYTLDMLTRYFDRVRTAAAETRVPSGGDSSLLALAAQEPPETVVTLLGTYLELARLLGQRTGELHLALASDTHNRDFAPEPFTPFYQRALYQSMRNLVVQNLDELQRRLAHVPEGTRPQATELAARENELLKRLRAIHEAPFAARRIRCHGDFHLGQVLFTGKDFIFIDFEGEPERSLGERRIKRSPLRDVASMLRSFDYVTFTALFQQLELGTLQEEQVAQLEPWTGFWSRWVSARYLKAYLETVKPANLLPHKPEQLAVLLEAHLLEKAIYEVGYELRHRPDWLRIPLKAVLQMLGTKPETAGTVAGK